MTRNMEPVYWMSFHHKFHEDGIYWWWDEDISERCIRSHFLWLRNQDGGTRNYFLQRIRNYLCKDYVFFHYAEKEEPSYPADCPLMNMEIQERKCFEIQMAVDGFIPDWCAPSTIFPFEDYRKTCMLCPYHKEIVNIKPPATKLSYLELLPIYVKKGE